MELFWIETFENAFFHIPLKFMLIPDFPIYKYFSMDEEALYTLLVLLDTLPNKVSLERNKIFKDNKNDGLAILCLFSSQGEFLTQTKLDLGINKTYIRKCRLYLRTLTCTLICTCQIWYH